MGAKRNTGADENIFIGFFYLWGIVISGFFVGWRSRVHLLPW